MNNNCCYIIRRPIIDLRYSAVFATVLDSAKPLVRFASSNQQVAFAASRIKHLTRASSDRICNSSRFLFFRADLDASK